MKFHGWVPPVGGGGVRTAPTGAVFCPAGGCGLPGHAGHLFFGSWNDAKIREVRFTANRLGVLAGWPKIALNRSDGILSMERNPVNGHLYFSDQNGITGSFNATTGTLTLTGPGTLAQFQAALRAVTYKNTSGDLAIAWATATTLSIIKRTAGTFGSAATTTPGVSSFNGLAMTYGFDWDMLVTGLDWKYFNMHQMEFYGKLNLLKTGIVFAMMWARDGRHVVFTYAEFSQDVILIRDFR